MRLRFEICLPASLATVFEFHEDPSHLALILKGRESFRLLRHDGSIAPGSMTWFQETIAALVPVTMGFRHTLLERPYGFSEEMVHGPFERFIHSHHFIHSNQFAETHEGTKVVDVLELSLPWYYGGELLTRHLIAPVVRRMFEQRHAALRLVFSRSTGREVVR
jgi:ligand-binding SRPBCC domain-containing protein